jgi:hypothetical protein
VPHLPAAAALILADRPHPDKQVLLAHATAAAEQLRLITRCYRWEDCLALLLAGMIEAVVCAIDPGQDVRAALEHSGRVVVARETQGRARRDVDQLMERMYQRGIDTQEISAILQLDTREVRRSLWHLRRRKSRE